MGRACIRQPLPDLRHMGERSPRFAVAKRARHLEALLCAAPILICPTHEIALAGKLYDKWVSREPVPKISALNPPG
jgi:hypothetical protein